MKKGENSADSCPICRGDNRCSGQYSCWCMEEMFTEEVFRRLPPEELNKSCVCPGCLRNILMQAEKQAVKRSI